MALYEVKITAFVTLEADSEESAIAKAQEIVDSAEIAEDGYPLSFGYERDDMSALELDPEDGPCQPTP